MSQYEFQSKNKNLQKYFPNNIISESDLEEVGAVIVDHTKEIGLWIVSESKDIKMTYDEIVRKFTNLKKDKEIKLITLSGSDEYKF